MNNETDLTEHSILIIDDTPTNLGVIADYLDDQGFDIVTARNGEDGIERAKYVRPDLILLDVMMPGIDGFETCRRLKADESTRDTPVIFMTALASEEDKVKGFEVGGIDYVTKPLYQEEVLARVTTHLRMRDLTQNLQKSNKALVELNATKDKFFSIVAHDLRGPFQPLLGNSTLLLTSVDDAPRSEVKEMVTSIHHSANQVYDLLENLLQWSQMERGRMDYHPNGIDLRLIAERIVALFVENAAGKRIDLQNTVAKDIFVYADKNMLEMIIRNLISNALKFTYHGGRVTISAESSHKTQEEAGEQNKIATPFITISVLDTGAGITPENLNKLFKLDTHHTTAGTDNEAGTGLGLILCQEMVEKNGGRIWIESEVGQGTTVKFTMPLQQSSSTTPYKSENDQTETASNHFTKVVENPPEARKKLIVPPAQDVLAILLDLSLKGNMIELEKQADQLAVENEALLPFANKLHHLIKNFDEEQILALIEQYLA